MILTRRFVLVAIALAFGASAQGAEWRFAVQFDSAVRAKPFSGRVYLFFSKNEKPEPRLGPNWFTPEPFASLDVEAWQPGMSLVIDVNTAELREFPKPLGELALEKLHV